VLRACCYSARQIDYWPCAQRGLQRVERAKHLLLLLLLLVQVLAD